MVETIKPRGAIAESLVKNVCRLGDKCYLRDTCSNLFEISTTDFNYLKEKGYPENEYYIKKTNPY